MKRCLQTDSHPDVKLTERARKGCGLRGWNMEQNMQIYTEKQRISKIKKEIKILTTVFQNLEESKLKLVKPLINEAAFQKVTLEETREIINRDGIIEEYQNGANQKGYKKSSAVEVYDRMIKTYTATIKQLCDLLPKDDMENSPLEELLKFTTTGRK